MKAGLAIILILCFVTLKAECTRHIQANINNSTVHNGYTNTQIALVHSQGGPRAWKDFRKKVNMPQPKARAGKIVMLCAALIAKTCWLIIKYNFICMWYIMGYSGTFMPFMLLIFLSPFHNLQRTTQLLHSLNLLYIKVPVQDKNTTNKRIQVANKMYTKYKTYLSNAPPSKDGHPQLIELQKWIVLNNEMVEYKTILPYILIASSVSLHIIFAFLYFLYLPFHIMYLYDFIFVNASTAYATIEFILIFIIILLRFLFNNIDSSLSIYMTSIYGEEAWAGKNYKGSNMHTEEYIAYLQLHYIKQLLHENTGDNKIYIMEEFGNINFSLETYESLKLERTSENDIDLGFLLFIYTIFSEIFAIIMWKGGFSIWFENTTQTMFGNAPSMYNTLGMKRKLLGSWAAKKGMCIESPQQCILFELSALFVIIVFYVIVHFCIKNRLNVQPWKNNYKSVIAVVIVSLFGDSLVVLGLAESASINFVSRKITKTDRTLACWALTGSIIMFLCRIITQYIRCISYAKERKTRADPEANFTNAILAAIGYVFMSLMADTSLIYYGVYMYDQGDWVPVQIAAVFYILSTQVAMIATFTTGYIEIIGERRRLAV